ncbi:MULTISPECIES: Flp family type IVb pilin [unclassified Blastococcus]
MLSLYTNLVCLAAVAQDRLKKDEKGATAVEYGLMVGLIAVVIIVAVTALGGRLDTLFRSIVTSLGGTLPGATP